MSLNAYVSILNAAPVPMLMIGRNDRVIAANERATALLGSGAESRHYVTFLRQPAVLDGIEAVLAERTERVEADYFSTEAMREATYRTTAARVPLETGWAVLVTFIDTTDVQEAGQMRRDFVANVSHELRTPLTAVLGFIETLRGAARDDPAARDRFLGIMEKEASRMNRLVRDLLSLSRVESQQRVRPNTPADIPAILRSVVSTLRPIAEEAGSTVALTGDDASADVPGDADQLAQVFSNLIENAVKYGGEGTRIEVELHHSDYDATVRSPAVIVTVSDDGEGIDPVHIPRLTERFYRIDSHRSRELGGTGLGLAIVKHIVNRHRGRLRIESAPGEGSRFTVILPIH